MGLMNLMILISRFVFLGFGIIFIILAFSFMKPFISYTLGEYRERYKLMYTCIVCFHIIATSILLGNATDWVMSKEILINSTIFLVAVTVARFILRFCYRQEVLIVWYLVFFLLSTSYIMLERLNHALASKQVIWMGIGLVGALSVPYLFKKLIHQKYKRLYGSVTMGLMVLPFIFGSARNGALNWVEIGPISFQPSEIAKVVLVLFFAAVFVPLEKAKSKRKILFQASIFLGVLLLILVFQRDLGSALLYFITFVMMAYLVTRSLWIPLLGIIGSGLGVGIGYLLFNHVRIRVDIWIDPFEDLLGTGYQVVQGLFAMGTWGFLGSGLTRGLPTTIPIVETDYIFAAIGEELGNGFAIIILLCYLGLILQGLKIALIQKNGFDTLVAMGITTLLGVQTLIIVGGVLKIIPLTGITMPFVSYGGSSMIVSFGMIGILSYLLSKSLNKAKKEVEEFET